MELEQFASKYFSDPTLEIENYLIMNEYPDLIQKSTGKVETLLELGVGHGYTVPIFEKLCDSHHVVEGSSSVIKNFKKLFPKCESKIVQCFFENFKPDIKYDVIVMGFVLEHVLNPRKLLRK